MTKKQTQLFLLPEDEAALSIALRADRPRLVFLDGNVWDGPEPATAECISHCRSPFVYLWDPHVVAALPAFRRKDGRMEGPTSGVVIEVTRSRMQGDALLSGRLAVGFGSVPGSPEKEMKAFVADVWRVLAKHVSNTLMAVSPLNGAVLRDRVPEYRAGHFAIKWARERASRFLKDRSTENYFRPREM